MRDYSYLDLADVTTDAKHKESLLNMLIEFDKFCQQHNLTYYLSGGTLLGAVRHKGFIPWDDDIDINMPRPDCERLMSLSGGKVSDYQLLSPNHTPKYHAYHWKLYDDSILLAKRRPGGIGKKIYPVFMDIFPIEGLPSTAVENRAHYAKIKVAKQQVNHTRGRIRYRGYKPLRLIRNRTAKAFYQFKGTDKYFSKVISIAKSIPYDKSDYVGVMMTNVHTTEERVVKSEYSPTIKLEFEGRMFSAPSGYDQYLKQLYGKNYMELLPVHKRISKHALVPFLAKKEVEQDL
jgi:lipopolysaccharide cholinephosphotransferase